MLLHKLISFTVCLLAVFPVVAQTEVPDTIAAVDGATRVTVVRENNGATVTVIGSQDNEDAYYSFVIERDTVQPLMSLTDPDWAPALPFTNSRRRYSTFKTTYFGGIHVGVPIPVASEHGLQPSFEIGILNVFAANYRPAQCGPEFSLGVGLSYRQFAVGSGMRLGCEERRLYLEPVEENVTEYSSRLRNFALTMPLTVRQNIYRSLNLSVTGILNFNTYTWASTHYRTDDGYTYDLKFKGLHQRLLTVDVMAAIGIDDVSLYARYSPMQMFSNGYGPDLRVLSVGLIAAF